MNVTVQSLAKMGLTFFYEEGKPRYRGPDAAEKVMIAELDRRAALMLPQVEQGIKEGRSGILAKLMNREAARSGECECCGDEMPAHVGGMCALCVGSYRRVLRGKGLIR